VTSIPATAAGRVNLTRVILGGLMAGLVMNVFDAATNGFVVAARWLAETNALNPALFAKVQATSTVGWITVDFLLGIITIWTYAAIRPRYGPGPRTAICAAIAVFLAGHLFYASYIFMGMYSAGLILTSSCGGLVGALAGGLAGGALYKE
jgi:hypothetical protein